MFRCPDRCRNKPPELKGVHVEESAKTVEIRDFKDNLRYKVVLSQEECDFPDVEPYALFWAVTVVAYVYGSENGLDILRINRKDNRPVSDYKWIQEQFDKCVRNYSDLVKAEVRDLQDISVYKDRIGYRLVKPECCATCRFAKRACFKDDFRLGQSGRIECHNPKNGERYSYDMAEFDNPRRRRPHDGMWQRLPWQRPGENRPPPGPPPCPGTIFPIVEWNGLCDGYEERQRPYRPCPGDSVADMIDKKVDEKYRDISGDLSAYVDGRIDASLDESISSKIIPEVGKAIEGQLSTVVIDGNRLLQDYNNDGVVNDEDFTVIGGNF